MLPGMDRLLLLLLLQSVHCNAMEWSTQVGWMGSRGHAAA